MLIEAMKKTIEEKQWDNGQVTADRIQNMMDKFKDDVVTSHKDEISALRQEVRQLNGGEPVQETTTTASPSAGAGGCTFAYKSRFWDVPQDFKFPVKVKLKAGLRFWFCGQSVGEGSDYVKPFRLLVARNLPSKTLQNNLKLQWIGAFKILEESSISLPPRSSRDVDEATLDRIFTEFVALLKQRFQYCFLKESAPEVKWTLGTWGVKMTRSNVVKYGTDSDKTFLSDATKRNEANNRNRSRNKRPAENVWYAHRRQRLEEEKDNGGDEGSGGN